MLGEVLILNSQLPTGADAGRAFVGLSVECLTPYPGTWLFRLSKEVAGGEGWDPNPRYGFPYTRFPSVRLRPLGHLTSAGGRFTWALLKREVTVIALGF